MGCSNPPRMPDEHAEQQPVRRPASRARQPKAETCRVPAPRNRTPASAKPTPDRRKPTQSSGRVLVGRYIGNKFRHQDHADEPDRHIDEEDPLPGQIGHDEAADRRAQNRPQQARDREIGHRVDQMDFGTDFSTTTRPTGIIIEPPTPCRIRARTNSSSVCDKPHSTEPSTKITIAEPEHAFRPVPVGDPAAHRNEDREAQQIGGDREIEADRVLVHVLARSPAGPW